MTIREAILRHLAKAKRPESPKEIAKALHASTDNSTIRVVLRQLRKEGAVKEASRKYILSPDKHVLVLDAQPKTRPTSSPEIDKANSSDSTVQVTLPEIMSSKIGPSTTSTQLLSIRERDRQKRVIVDVMMTLILKGVNSPSKIAKEINFKRTRAAYYLKFMKDNGLIRRRLRSNIAIYDVTPRGVSLLQAATRNLPIGRFENFRIDYRILRDNPDFLPVSDGSKLNSGVRQTTGKLRLDGNEYTVSRFHSQSGDQLYIWAPRSYTTGEVPAIHDATIEVSAVAREIQRRYEIVLSKGEVTHPGEIAFDDPFAKWFLASGGPNVKVTTDEGKVWIDGSPKTGKKPPGYAKGVGRGELEFATSGDEGRPGLAQGYLDFVTRGPRLMEGLLETGNENLTQSKANNALVKELIDSTKEVVSGVKEMGETFKQKMEEIGEKMSEVGSKFDRITNKLDALSQGAQETTPAKSESDKKHDRRRYT